MRVFLDSDVILDCVLARPDFKEDASMILNLCETGTIEGLTSTLIVANCHYVFSKQENAAKSRDVIARLRALLRVCAVGDHELSEALVSNFSDLEDGIQYFTALNNQAAVIVTRNTQDFKAAAIPIMTPRELLVSLNAV
jgi:predicted nucleic acid-binding protein